MRTTSPHQFVMGMMMGSSRINNPWVTLIPTTIAFIGTLVLYVMWKRRKTQHLLLSSGLPTVFWRPKFVSFSLNDHQKLASSSITGILPRMKRLKGPYGMYGTVYGVSTAVVHVAHPIPARQVLAGTSNAKEDANNKLAAFNGAIKAPAYDHFKNFSGNGVFTSDGTEWKAKRTSLLHVLLRNHDRDLEKETNHAADGFLQDVSRHTQTDTCALQVVDNIVPILQRATVGLVYRYITHDDDMDTRIYQNDTDSSSEDASHSSSSCTHEAAPSPKRDSFSSTRTEDGTSTATSFPSLLQSYLDAVTNIRMIVLAQSRSLWFLLPRWFYKMFSTMYRQEEETMVPIRVFAKMAIQHAKPTSPLARLKKRSSHSKNDTDVLDEAITLLFAGQDTSAATLSWTLHLLSLYPLVQEKLAAEIRSVVPETDNGDVYITKKHIARMPYLDAVIKESMRLYPVAPFVVRKLPHDVTVSNHGDGATSGKVVLPSGALACIWIYALHRNESIWDRPNDFVPERWMQSTTSEENKKSETTCGASYMPFAAGPRNCVGQPMAHVILRIMLARMIHQYQWSDPRATENSDPRLLLKDMQAGFTVLPSGGVRLCFNNRC